MKTKNEQFEVLIPKADGSGTAEKVTVTIPVRWDEELHDWLMTPEAHEIIENTKARRIGLLLPIQFRELRERYGYSQKEMGELFQVGEKSWTRWESGKHRPSRSINLLIRALYDGEISIEYLLKLAGKPTKPALASTAVGVFIASWHNALTSAPKTAPDLIYSAESGANLILQCKACHGKGEFADHLVKIVEDQPDSTEQVMLPSQQSLRHRARQAPTHNYAQPRLTFPTVA